MLRHTLPSTLSSHSPSTHLPLSRHPARVTLSDDTHVPSLSHTQYKYLSMVIQRSPSCVCIPNLYAPLRDPQLTFPLPLVALHSSHSQLLHSPRQQTAFRHIDGDQRSPSCVCIPNLYAPPETLSSPFLSLSSRSPLLS